MSVSYHVYGNGGTGGPIDYTTPIATTAATTWSSAALGLGASWRFAVRAFDTVSSAEETNVDAVVVVNLDSAGRDLAALPRAPLFLHARAGASGAIEVTFLQPKGGPKPTGFHVYAGVGSVSYTTAIATIAGNGPRSYRAMVGGYSDGDIVTIAVRTYNGAGEETNTNTVTVTARVAGPAAVVNLTGAATAVTGDGRS